MDEIRLSRGYVPIRAVCGPGVRRGLAFAEPEQIVLQGIRRLEAYLRSIGMPVRLGEAGIDDSRLLEMAEKCCAKGPQGQFQKLHTRDVHAIYELAL